MVGVDAVIVVAEYYSFVFMLSESGLPRKRENIEEKPGPLYKTMNEGFFGLPLLLQYFWIQRLFGRTN